METIKKNRTRLITFAVLVFLIYTAVQGMDTEDWVITVLRGLSVGMVTFLVAAGFSLILGLMDVLNLAHGEMFMLGAYVGWTVFVRPDTFVDLVPPLALFGRRFCVVTLVARVAQPVRIHRPAGPVLALAAAAGRRGGALGDDAALSALHLESRSLQRKPNHLFAGAEPG